MLFFSGFIFLKNDWKSFFFYIFVFDLRQLLCGGYRNIYLN